MVEPIHPLRVRLRVSDVHRSAGFYAGVVGLRVVSQTAAEAALADPGDGGQVLLELVAAQRPGRAPRRSSGLFHTAFLYPDRARLGAALRRVAGHRVSLTGASDHLVSEALYLDDPDGHGIELYRDRPRAQWPSPPPGQKVAMGTLPLDLGPLLDEPDITAAAEGVRIGHVHLKVADLAAATGFWQDAGLELMAAYGAQAAFLASGGYHHDVGVNTWASAGAPLDPAEGPGLDAVVMACPPGAEAARRLTPDGLTVLFEPGRSG